MKFTEARNDACHQTPGPVVRSPISLTLCLPKIKSELSKNLFLNLEIFLLEILFGSVGVYFSEVLK